MPPDDSFDANALPMDDDSFRQEQMSHKPGDWDQFAGNAHLISGQSTYNELLYTTPIPENVPKHWTERAYKIAAEEPTPDTGRMTADEETNHSLVVANNVGITSEASSAHIFSPTKATKRKNTDSAPTTYHNANTQQKDVERQCPAEGCTWKTPPHSGKWQAFYHHVAHRHGKNIPNEWWEGEGRFLCRECGRHYAKNKLKSLSPQKLQGPQQFRTVISPTNGTSPKRRRKSNRQFAITRLHLRTSHEHLQRRSTLLQIPLGEHPHAILDIRSEGKHGRGMDTSRNAP